MPLPFPLCFAAMTDVTHPAAMGGTLRKRPTRRATAGSKNSAASKADEDESWDDVFRDVPDKVRTAVQPILEKYEVMYKSRLRMLRTARERTAEIRRLQHMLARRHKREYPLNPWGIALSDVDFLALENAHLRDRIHDLEAALRAAPGM